MKLPPHLHSVTGCGPSHQYMGDTADPIAKVKESGGQGAIAKFT
jgi:hypothetical protein